MLAAIITGDIIDSTKLNEEEGKLLINGLTEFLHQLEQESDIRGELFRGDSIQLLVNIPKDALKIALLLKMYVKGILVGQSEKMNRQEMNKAVHKSPFDIRLALGIGEINHLNEKLSISQGEAFNLSGRLLDEMKNRQTIAIRTSDVFNNEFEASFKLLDFILSNATQNQCEVIFYKLQGLTEVEISEKIGVNQSAINQRSNSSGWNAIFSLTQRFQEIYA